MHTNVTELMIPKFEMNYINLLHKQTRKSFKNRNNILVNAKNAARTVINEILLQFQGIASMTDVRSYVANGAEIIMKHTRDEISKITSKLYDRFTELAYRTLYFIKRTMIYILCIFVLIYVVMFFVCGIFQAIKSIFVQIIVRKTLKGGMNRDIELGHIGY